MVLLQFTKPKATAGRRGCGSTSHSKSSSTAILYLFGATFNLWIWIIKFAHNGSAKSQANCCCSFFVAHELVWRYYWLVAEWFMDGIPNLTIISFQDWCIILMTDRSQAADGEWWNSDGAFISLHFMSKMKRSSRSSKNRMKRKLFQTIFDKSPSDQSHQSIEGRIMWDPLGPSYLVTNNRIIGNVQHTCLWYFKRW